MFFGHYDVLVPMIYESHFALSQRPFSIAPNPEFLFAVGQYQEALAALEFGMMHRGGFVLLTGEVGTGKTTLCKHLLNDVPDNTELALVLHPQLDRLSLLQLICREFDVVFEQDDKEFQLIERLTEFLLSVYAKGGYSVLIIDEAQHLDRDVLELIRLLTNLETHQDKLLQIILLGQPELQQRLNQYDLRQLNQRFTARYHLQPLSIKDTVQYVKHRLKVAGGDPEVFSYPALVLLQKISGGIPRVINVIADRCLMGAFAQNRLKVGAMTVKQAAKEVMPGSVKKQPTFFSPLISSLLNKLAVVCLVAFAVFNFNQINDSDWFDNLHSVFSNQSKYVSGHCEIERGCWQGFLPNDLLPAAGSDVHVKSGQEWKLLSDSDLDAAESNLVSGGLKLIRMDWSLPFSTSTLIKPDEDNTAVGWVRSILNRSQFAQSDVFVDEQNVQWQVIKPSHNANGLSLNETYYDVTLEGMVKAFQREYGLTVDGILGQQTLLSLSLYEQQLGQTMQTQGGL